MKMQKLDKHMLLFRLAKVNEMKVGGGAMTDGIIDGRVSSEHGSADKNYRQLEDVILKLG